MSMKWRQYALTGETIDRISEWVQEECARLGTEKQEKQRIRLTIEEILIRIREHSEGEIPLEAGIGSRFGNRQFCLRYAGPSFDPTDYDKDDWSSRILSDLGISPAWSFRGNTNLVSFPLAKRRRHGTTFGIAIAVAAAILLGFLGRLLPETVRSGLDSILLMPVTNGFLGLLNTFAGLMIAFAICSGILGMGDPVTLRKTGKGFLLQIVLLSTAASAFALVLSAPALGLWISGGEQSQFALAGTISEMLFAILPYDSVTPFLTPNTMQIIVIAMFIGVALLAIGDQAMPLRDVVNSGTQLFTKIMMAICRLIPLYVFTALLRQLWSGSIMDFLSVWKPVALGTGLSALFLLLMLLLTAWQTHCPVSLLFRKIFPPFLVALTTASSMAAFQSSMEAGRKKLGVDPAFLQFAYPIGSVMYMPSAAICLTVIAVHCAKEYGITVDLSWFITAVVITSLLAIAVPPLPGSGFMIFSTLLVQLGIPAEAMLLVTLFYVVVDYVISGVDVGALLLELTREARQLKMLDQETLRTE